MLPNTLVESTNSVSIVFNCVEKLIKDLNTLD